MSVRVFTQDDLDAIVRREKAKAERKAAREYRQQIEDLAQERVALAEERDLYRKAFQKIYREHTGFELEAEENQDERRPDIESSPSDGGGRAADSRAHTELTLLAGHSGRVQSGA